MWALGPRARGLGPWAHGPGALGPGPGAPGLGPWARGPGPWALGPGPKMEKGKIDLRPTKKTPGFRMARIDPSRQGVMTEASFVRGEIYFLP